MRRNQQPGVMWISDEGEILAEIRRPFAGGLVGHCAGNAETTDAWREDLAAGRIPRAVPDASVVDRSG